MTPGQNSRVVIPPELKRMLARALQDPESFWGEVASELHWFRRWEKVFEWNYPEFSWFKGGATNLSYNCLERNIEKGSGKKPALIWENGKTCQDEFSRTTNFSLR